ncbi:lactate 2-monooxygenase [Streptacidiphilus sp. 4-A2]|nr:lactate 2-monooxygenase [Streptacidiphilus sp. 4-A2]
MAKQQFGDYQNEIYFSGLFGVMPKYPMAFAGWEAAAQARCRRRCGPMSPGRRRRVHPARQCPRLRALGAGARMLVGAAERDLSVELFGQRLPSPLFMSPVGVLGLCAQDGHGDLAAARAAARTGVPMVASTLSADPLEDVAAALGDTPGYFQLYTPTDRELAASLVRRAEAAGFKGIVVTLDTWVTGWRPRDLSTSNFPQLRGNCLANYTSDPVFRAALGKAPQEDPGAVVQLFAKIFGNPLTWDDLPWLRSLTTLPLLLKGISTRRTPAGPGTTGWTGSTAPPRAGARRNGGLAALDALPGVWSGATAGGALRLGVRGGADLVKALGLGATRSASAARTPTGWPSA